MSANDRDVQAFLEHLDALAERLRPKRRPQDAGARERIPMLPTIGDRRLSRR